MKKGENLGIMPGGFEECVINSSKEQRIYIKNRKGFIKYALKYGYTIYPTFCFGENKAYYTLDIIKKFRLLIYKIYIPMTFFFSWFLLVPTYDKSFHTVIGKGI